MHTETTGTPRAPQTMDMPANQAPNVTQPVDAEPVLVGEEGRKPWPQAPTEGSKERTAPDKGNARRGDETRAPARQLNK
jgi:hypothetical protein